MGKEKGKEKRDERKGRASKVKEERRAKWKKGYMKKGKEMEGMEK